MKKILALFFAAVCLLPLEGCLQDSPPNESSSVTESVPERSLTAYDKQVLADAVEQPLNSACTTLYEGVSKGSLTRKSVEGRFSFAEKLPADNASPSEKQRAAQQLTLQDAIEYFGIESAYSQDNIRDYGYLLVGYSSLPKGTIVKVRTLEKYASDWTAFQNTAIPLSDFLT